jgi:hypothetical protein
MGFYSCVNVQSLLISLSIEGYYIWSKNTLAVVPKSLILFILMMESICSSETSLLTRAKQRNIPEDGILQEQIWFSRSHYYELVTVS